MTPSGVFTINFEQILHIGLVFPSLAVNKEITVRQSQSSLLSTINLQEFALIFSFSQNL